MAVHALTSSRPDASATLFSLPQRSRPGRGLDASPCRVRPASRRHSHLCTNETILVGNAWSAWMLSRPTTPVASRSISTERQDHDIRFQVHAGARHGRRNDDVLADTDSWATRRVLHSNIKLPSFCAVHWRLVKTPPRYRIRPAPGVQAGDALATSWRQQRVVVAWSETRFPNPTRSNPDEKENPGASPGWCLNWSHSGKRWPKPN